MEKIKDLLFNHKNQKQVIIKNTFWLALAEGITRFLKFILIVYVARILGATEYGKFTFALAFTSIFIIFSDFGLSTIITREFSQEKEREKEFSAIISLKILLSLGTFILILLGSFFITKDLLIQKIIWILGIYAILSNFCAIFFAFFQARQKMEYQSWSQILEAIFLTGFGFFVLFKFPSVQNLSYSYLFGSFLAFVFILIFFHLKVFPLRISFEKFIWKKFLKMSWPLALTALFASIYSYTDSVMLGYFKKITENGWYNAAFKIASATSIPMTLISQSFYPALSSAFKESKERLQKIWDYQMGIMIFLAVPIVTGGIVLAPKIIDFVYDPSFFPSILAFQILIIMIGIVFLLTPFNQILIVSHLQEKVFLVSFSGAIFNVILNLILIPRYSLYGAAIATVITYLLILFLLFKFTQKLTPIKPFNVKLLFSFFGAGIASFFMYFLISQTQIYNLNILFTISIGASLYFICFLLYKKILDIIKQY